MTTPKPTGEPYRLAGKRLVFNNWLYVRPGTFAWLDDSGKNVSVGGSEGPWGAHFRRLDYPHGIRIKAQPAERRGPTLDLERPWESKGISISTIIKEGDRFRGWGNCSPQNGGGVFCYFESHDALYWERPELGMVEFEGSRKNNLLAGTPGTVFFDPSAPTEERYKWVTEGNISREEYEAFKRSRPDAWEPRADRPDAKLIFAIKGAVSSDGLHWNALPEPLAVEHSDTQIVACFDEQIGKYVMYTRNYMIGERSKEIKEDRFRVWWDLGRRSIGRSESSDFRHFPLSEVIIEPGPDLLPSDVLYTNCKTTIPGAPNQHMMFPAIWHTSDDTTSISIASSTDGRVWNFLPDSPVFHTAPFGEWDGGSVFAHPNLLELPNGDFAIPYTGYNVPHKYPRGQFRFQPGLAVWPKGRLVALESPEFGEFSTVGVVPPGNRFFINALTRRAGSILIEAADIDGNPIPGRSFADALPVVGDHQRKQVTWRGGDDLGGDAKAGVILRFRMDKASIFALEFE